MALLLLCVALSIDSFSVGCSFGLRRMRVPLRSYAVLFCLSGALTGAAVFFGDRLSLILPGRAADLFGMAILAGIGAWTIVRAFRPDGADAREAKRYQLNLGTLRLSVQVIRRPESCDFDGSNSISPGEAAFLALGLSVDAMAAGVGSGLAGFPVFAVPLLAASLSLVFLSLGRGLGGRFSRLRDALFMKLLPGGLLILTGLLKLIPIPV
ncbi:sporulation membrane protein YtaF [Oscillospiraceae bacterium OttesenSCG-928-F05]|nr:sporulation membrane protein YtaF [Oscillospiraceae bacterium OttesenSCG-928-F05]